MMRLYETTSTVTQNECNIPKRYAHYLQNMKIMRMMALIFGVLGIVCAAAAMQHSLLTAIVCLVAFGGAAAICIPVGAWSSKRVAANFYEDGGDSWTMTTWFDNDGIHRMDEDGDEFAYPLNKLVCAYRAEDVLLLCSGLQTVLPVNLAQLSEADRASVLESIGAGCPKFKWIPEK